MPERSAFTPKIWSMTGNSPPSRMILPMRASYRGTGGVGQTPSNIALYGAHQAVRTAGFVDNSCVAEAVVSTLQDTLA